MEVCINHRRLSGGIHLAAAIAGGRRTHRSPPDCGKSEEASCLTTFLSDSVVTCITEFSAANHDGNNIVKSPISVRDFDVISIIFERSMIIPFFGHRSA